MASPFPGTLAVIKVEDEENSGVSDLGDQELRKKFWEDVKRRVELKKRGSIATGSAQPPPPPPPPPSVQVQPPPPPSKLPPKAPSAHNSLAKRLFTEPPPGFAGVRQPPTKQYQRRPQGQRAPAQPQQQPAPPTNAQRAPGPPPANAQRAPQHAPAVVLQPAPSACRALAPSGPGAMPPPLQLVRSAPRPPPRHPAAKKKPTVPCAFCGVLCMTAWHLKQHEKGRRHRNKVAYLAGEVNVRCPVCNVHLSGALNVQQHYAGKQHFWRLKHGGA